jgi:hypothetical protein
MGWDQDSADRLKMMVAAMLEISTKIKKKVLALNTMLKVLFWCRDSGLMANLSTNE